MDLSHSTPVRHPCISPLFVSEDSSGEEESGAAETTAVLPRYVALHPFCRHYCLFPHVGVRIVDRLAYHLFVSRGYCASRHDHGR